MKEGYGMYKKIGIIIPVYNCEKYIGKCIKSILSQSYDNFELLVVNDGSTDNTLNILNKLKNLDKRITIINQKNKGSIEARKTGLRELSIDTNYFCFIDADDYVHKRYIEIMLKNILEYDADIVSCNLTKFIGVYKERKPKFIPDCFQQKNIYSTVDEIRKLYISYFGVTNFPGYVHSKLYHIKFKEKMISLKYNIHFMPDDLATNIRILLDCKKIICIPDKLYFYRYGGGTSKFMKYFMIDYINYHKIQNEMIAKYNLPFNFKKYSAIEIINVLYNWLIMCDSLGKYSKQKLQKETYQWLENYEINTAIDIIKSANINCDFIKLIEENEFIDIYKQIKKLSWKRKIKINIMKIFEVICNVLER